MALPAATLFASFVGFEDARVCATGRTSPRVEGRLVADTANAVLLTQEVAKEVTVIRVPASQVAVLQYGAKLKSLPPCPNSA